MDICIVELLSSPSSTIIELKFKQSHALELAQAEPAVDMLNFPYVGMKATAVGAYIGMWHVGGAFHW